MKEDLSGYAREQLTFAINRLQLYCYQLSEKKGFWDCAPNKGEKIALMHSELSEMLEGIRKPSADSHCPEFTSEEVELADLLIRAFDYAGYFQLNLVGALLAKLDYNTTREYKHGKAF